VTRRRLRVWAVVLLAGSAGVLAGAVGLRWWLVLPGAVALAAVGWWARPRSAAVGGWLALFLAAVGAASAPDGRWLRFLVFAGYALLGSALAWLAASTDDRWGRLITTCALVLGLVVAPLLPGPDVPVTGTGDEEAEASGLSSEQVAALEDFLRGELEAFRLPGLAVAVVHGDRPAVVRGYGVAGPDREPITPDTSFVMASVSKGFTALAVLQLVEAGEVDLDAPVQEYLPWFEVADEEASATMTVRQLLNQTSGFTTPQGWNLIERNTQHSIEEDVRKAADYELHDPPGTEWRYSNVNFQVAGAIVEAVTGRPYEEYMEEKVFAPLGMTSTSAGNDDAHASGLATGYRDWWGAPLPFGTTIIDGAVPMGGISSSAADMAAYLIAQLNDGRLGDAQVLSAEGIRALHEEVVPTDPDDEDPTSFYGLGWARDVDEDDGTVTIGHDGTAPQFSAGMRLRPDTGWGVVVLVNRQAAFAQPAPPIADGALAIVTGEDLAPTVGGRAAWNLVVVGLVSVALVALVVGDAAGLGRRRIRTRSGGRGRMVRAVVGGLAVNLALPILLLGVPRLMEANWSLVWAYEPGVVLVFWATALGLLALGVAKLALAFELRRRRAPG